VSTDAAVEEYESDYSTGLGPYPFPAPPGSQSQIRVLWSPSSSLPGSAVPCSTTIALSLLPQHEIRSAHPFEKWPPSDHEPVDGERNDLRRLATFLRCFTNVGTTLHEMLFRSCVMRQMCGACSWQNRRLCPFKCSHLPRWQGARGRSKVLQLCFDRSAQLSLSIMHVARLTALFRSLPKGQMAEQPVIPAMCSYTPEQLAEWFGDVDW